MGHGVKDGVDMRDEEKFPHKVEVLAPIGGRETTLQMDTLRTWLNENVGCEEIRWTRDIELLNPFEQEKTRCHARIIFRFKLETASTHFKLVWG